MKRIKLTEYAKSLIARLGESALFMSDEPRKLNLLKRFKFSYKHNGFTINRVVKAVDYIKAISAIRSKHPKVVLQKIKEVS
jgi:hypothetical protein|tara:strand:- start:2124 stop:2366 length:243 start_codon:yes stop_codon:yes gene_type:complete